jgi:hypothetical protein
MKGFYNAVAYQILSLVVIKTAEIAGARPRQFSADSGHD